MADVGGDRRRLADEGVDPEPNPARRQPPSILDLIYESFQPRMVWNPFSTGTSNNSPPNSVPGAMVLARRDPAPPPPARDPSFRLLRDIFGGPPEDERPPNSRPDPEINFGSCGGMEEQIKYIRRNIIGIFNLKAEFARWGQEPAKGVIFYGPPGSGKSLLAKAMANELKTPDGLPFSFLMTKGPELFGKWVGQTEKAIRDLFAAAKAQAPAIIFLDELDGLCSSREDSSMNNKFHNGVITQLLGCMDEVVRGEVIVIGATNRLEAIDPAFRRPGRFDKSICFHLPNAAARTRILKIHSRRWLNQPPSHDYEAVGSATVGYSGADLEQLCRDTFGTAFHRQFPDFEESGPLDLSSLQIQAEDWQEAMLGATRSNPNVFGNALYSGEVTNPDILLLTSGMEGELSAKLMPWLRRIKQNQGTQVNACLIWSEHRRSVEAANTHIIPSFISSIDPNQFLAYRMRFADIINSNAIESFMYKVMDPRKTRLLFVPNMDDLVAHAVQAGLWIPLTTALSRLRGANVLLLATACRDISDLQEDMGSLFSSAESVKIRKAMTHEAERFFQQVFTVGFYEEQQKDLPCISGREVRDSGDASIRTPTPEALRKLQTDLAPLLARAIDFSVRSELQDSLDMKGDLLKAVDSKLDPGQYVAELKNVLGRYHPDHSNRGRGRPSNMYR